MIIAQMTSLGGEWAPKDNLSSLQQAGLYSLRFPSWNPTNGIKALKKQAAFSHA